jgi:hypothetical protein
MTTSVVFIMYLQNYVAISHQCTSLEQVYHVHLLSPLGRYFRSVRYVMHIG